MADTQFPKVNLTTEEGRLKLIRFICIDGGLTEDENDVTPDKAFVADLEADSLSVVELIMNMEEGLEQNGYKVEIEDERAEKVVTVQDALDLLAELVS